MTKLLVALLFAIAALVPVAAHADCSSTAAKTIEAQNLVQIITSGTAADRTKIIFRQSEVLRRNVVKNMAGGNAKIFYVI